VALRRLEEDRLVVEMRFGPEAIGVERLAAPVEDFALAFASEGTDAETVKASRCSGSSRVCRFLGDDLVLVARFARDAVPREGLEVGTTALSFWGSDEARGGTIPAPVPIPGQAPAVVSEASRVLDAPVCAPASPDAL
jgi:hypothetical protein